ncbi:AMP-binding protein [Hyphococcus sp. DH-69]|uniref:AMP-binding protein n=1 Tax=Hyphococcus formosus TaxID=3143534 RepID=UPI00398B47F5
MTNFFETLHSAFADRTDKTFLRLPNGTTYSYGDIDALSARISASLTKAGAKPGDRIVVQVEKSPENVALYLGAMRAGLTYVPLNTAYTADEVDYFLKDADPAIFVCAPDRQKTLSAVTQNIPRGFTLGTDHDGSLIDALEPENFHIEARGPDDLAAILYTSGTTGRSKGAMLTHDNLRSNAKALNELWGFSGDDVLLHALPIFHIHGLFVALHTVMLSAAEIIFLPKFNKTQIRKQLPDATLLMGVPTFYTRLLADEDFGLEDCKTIRLFISGSAPLTKETFESFEKRTGHKILERYGMSEAGMITSNPLKGDRIAGTVGFPLPGISVRVASGEDIGEIEVKGPNICAGYWRKEDKSAEAFTDDGYFKTGDVGHIDKEGRLSLVGREKDLIIVGGLNIYPIEIEQCLDAIPGIADSAVIGVPHPDMGEGVVAVLVAETAPLAQSVIDAALSSLADFKRPRKFFWVDALPRNTMGKVQKQAMREQYRSAFS